MNPWANYPPGGNGTGKGYGEKGHSEKGNGEKGYGQKGYGYGDKGREKGKEKGWKGKQLPDITYADKTLPGRMKVDYKPHPTIETWDLNSIEHLRLRHNIEVGVSEGEVHAPAPVDDLSLMSGMADSLKADMMIRKPTAIQMQVWPAAMSGRDIIGVAPTGSGKTLAYMLPMFEHCQAQPKSTATGPIALILVPNVDLARQIKSTFDKCRKARRELKMALAVPGEKLPLAEDRYHILVASPGKLHDLILNLHQETTTFFERTTYVVVDEADHLLTPNKDGADQTIQILGQLRPDIQMLYFTATWDESLPRDIGRVFKSASGSREPLLEVIVNGKTLSACRDVQQRFLRRTNGEPDRDAVGEREREESRSLNQFWLQEDTKEDALYRLLYEIVKEARKADNPGNSKILVFTNSKEKVGELYDIIAENDLPVMKLTGETWQRDRNITVTSFADPNQSDKLILITTDMLGRGIDFTTCRYVILYDFPCHKNCVREYVHRIGRTGRAGRQGFSITLLDENDGDFRHCPEIVKVLEASGQKVPKWMEAERRRNKHHKEIFFSLRNQRTEEPSTPRTAPTETPTASTAPTGPGPAFSASSEVGTPISGLPDVGRFAPGRVQQRKYGSYLAEVNIPCSPMYDLQGFCEDHRVPMMDSVEKERRFPIVF